MKSIELKTVMETVIFKGVKTDMEFLTTELIKTAANASPASGMNITDMMNRIRVLDAVEAYEKNPESNGVLNIEDSDYENLKKYVMATNWGIVSRSIESFAKSFGIPVPK